MSITKENQDAKKGGDHFEVLTFATNRSLAKEETDYPIYPPINTVTVGY